MEDRKKVIVVAPVPQDAERLKTILEESGEFAVSEVLRDLSEAKSESVASGVVMVDTPDLPSSDGDELSSREKEILVCVAKGMLNKEIADKLCLSIYTVITHRKNIMEKLHAHSLADIII